MDRAPNPGRRQPPTAAGPTGSSTEPGRGIARRELEAVIRRAAELHLADSDADEQVSQEELLRIGTELGLPARHVWQALYELPEDGGSEPGLLDRIFGPDAAIVGRAVPGDAEAIRRRMLEYLTTREYLQLRRRQGDIAWFEPADDAVSNMIRALRRPARRFHLARARRVGLAVRPIEPATAHIRVELDLSDRRRAGLIGGLTLGGLAGAGLGAGTFLAVGALSAPLPTPAGIIAGVAAGGASFFLAVSGGLTAASARFRRKAAAARLEIDGLLDRLERGESLQPPPAPWWRRLQAAAKSPARHGG